MFNSFIASLAPFHPHPSSKVTSYDIMSTMVVSCATCSISWLTLRLLPLPLLGQCDKALPPLNFNPLSSWWPKRRPLLEADSTSFAILEPMSVTPLRSWLITFSLPVILMCLVLDLLHDLMGFLVHSTIFLNFFFQHGTLPLRSGKDVGILLVDFFTIVWDILTYRNCLVFSEDGFFPLSCIYSSNFSLALWVNVKCSFLQYFHCSFFVSIPSCPRISRHPSSWTVILLNPWNSTWIFSSLLLTPQPELMFFFGTTHVKLSFTLQSLFLSPQELMSSSWSWKRPCFLQ